VVLPNGTLETKNILTFSNGNKTLGLSGAFSIAPAAGAMFAIQGTDVVARQFRTLAVRETEEHLFEVTALICDPTKYARIESNTRLDPRTYVRPRNIVTPPDGIQAQESRYVQDGVPKTRITLSWSAPDDFLAQTYNISADTPKGYIAYGTSETTSIDINDVIEGDYTFYLNAVSRTGVPSIVVSFPFTATGWQAITGPLPTTLQIKGGGTTFTGTAPTITWTNVFPPDSVIYPIENVVRVYDSLGALLRTETVRQQSYTYSLAKNQTDGGPHRNLTLTVTAKDMVGTESAPASIDVSNPVPAAVTPDVSSNGPSIIVKWAAADNDYAGSLVWISDVPDFDPATLDPVYDGTDTALSWMMTASGLYYVRVAAYDRFGKTGLNIGPTVSVSSSGLDVGDFDKRIQDFVSDEFKNITDDINKTEGLIASLAAEQDAANWLDKRKVRTELVSAKTELSSAIVESVATAQTNAEEALAAYSVTVNAQLGTLNTSVSTNATAIAGINGVLAGGYTVILDVNGYISGLKAYNDGSSSQFVILADSFLIAKPGIGGGLPIPVFSVSTVGGVTKLVLRGDMIADGTITAAKMTVGSLTAISANFGNATVQGKITAQNGKMSIDFANGRIEVFD
jgi:predicted phage tail protein